MRHGFEESPVNPLPPVVWALVLPIALSEIAFVLGEAGMIGGAQGVGLRAQAIQLAAYPPEAMIRFLQRGEVPPWQLLYRLASYPFVHFSFTHAAFVGVLTLALGKVLSERFSPWGLLGLFFGSAVLAACAYTLLGALLSARFGPLVGGYTAVYGLIGGFTYLLWTGLGSIQANRFAAFSLIGVLLGLQLVFSIVFGAAGTAWIAEVIGFAVGFAGSAVLLPGGAARLRRRLRQR